MGPSLPVVGAPDASTTGSEAPVGIIRGYQAAPESPAGRGGTGFLQS